MPSQRWIVIGALTVAVALAAGYGGYRAVTAAKSATEKDAAKKADPVLALASVDIARSGPATLAQTLSVAGAVEASRQAIVRSRHAGIVTGISKRAGDRVQSGERLARVDSDELRLRLNERESVLRQTQSALAVAESARAQQRSLSDRGFISRAALDATESSYIAARSANETARTQLDMARSSLAETVLIAPISGVISKRSIEPGERVSNEMAVFTILDPGSLEVVVPIAAERVTALKSGQKAQFQLDSGGQSVEATLSRIIPSSGSAARTVETRFSLPANTAVPAGAFLSGQLLLGQTAAAVAVPRIAVRTDVNGSYVWVVHDNKAQRRRVKLATNADEASALVPVSEGLETGLSILTLRGIEPNDGQTVSLPGATPAMPGITAPTAQAVPAAAAGAASTSTSK